MRRGFVVLLVTVWTASMLAQTPRPFPMPTRPGTSSSTPEPKAATPSPQPDPAPNAPTEAMLGFPIYPNAQFIASYDAGLGQRYYLFGAQAGFNEIVTYYKTMLKQKGELVFEQPPTQMFEIGKFRDEIMAFPPGVTVKDFTGGGLEGYPNPKRGTAPKSFPTIIQIVPPPPGAER